MSRILLLLFGGTTYLLFNGVFLYLAAFLLELPVPKTINSGVRVGLLETLAVDLGAIFLFGFLHSLMARRGFKRVWTRLVPSAAERSVYVLQSSLCLAVLMWGWRPLPEVIWSFDGHAALPLYGAFAAGIAIVLWSSYLIDHYELFGLRQVWCRFNETAMPEPEFRTPALYRLVRHPMQTGALMVFWLTPHMTVGHVLLAAAMTVYVVIGLHFEDRALLRQFGAEYAAYRARVPMLLPWPRRRDGALAEVC